MSKTFEDALEAAFFAGYQSGVHDGGNAAGQMDEDYKAFRQEWASNG